MGLEMGLVMGWGLGLGRPGSGAVRFGGWAGLGCFLLACLGCSGGQSGLELTVKPPARSVGGGAEFTLRLPADEPFALTYAPASQSPGLGGKAAGSATAGPDGSATAAAEVEQGGNASGAFQVGHAFRNDSDRQVDLSVRLALEFEYEVAATPPSGLSGGSVGLRVLARTGFNRVVREVVVAQHATDAGAVAESAARELRFELTFAPGETLTIYAAGTANVETTDVRSARVRLALRGMKMEVVSRPAPAVSVRLEPPAPHEPHEPL